MCIFLTRRRSKGKMMDDACQIVFPAIIALADLLPFYRYKWFPSFLYNKNRFGHGNMEFKRAGQPNRG
jgi:hypothetical protein